MEHGGVTESRRRVIARRVKTVPTVVLGFALVTLLLGLLLYPEGTRFTSGRRERALERIAEQLALPRTDRARARPGRDAVASVSR